MRGSSQFLLERDRCGPRDPDPDRLDGDDHRVTVTVTASAAGTCSQDMAENLPSCFTARNKNNREHRRHLWLVQPADVRSAFHRLLISHRADSLQLAEHSSWQFAESVGVGHRHCRAVGTSDRIVWELTMSILELKGVCGSPALPQTELQCPIPTDPELQYPIPTGPRTSMPNTHNTCTTSID